MSEDQSLSFERRGRFLGSPGSCGNAQRDTEMAENHKPEEHRPLRLGFARRMEAVLCETNHRNCENC